MTFWKGLGGRWGTGCWDWTLPHCNIDLQCCRLFPGRQRQNSKQSWVFLFLYNMKHAVSPKENNQTNCYAAKEAVENAQNIAQRRNGPLTQLEDLNKYEYVEGPAQHLSCFFSHTLQDRDLGCCSSNVPEAPKGSAWMFWLSLLTLAVLSALSISPGSHVCSFILICHYCLQLFNTTLSVSWSHTQGSSSVILNHLRVCVSFRLWDFQPCRGLSFHDSSRSSTSGFLDLMNSLSTLCDFWPAYYGSRFSDAWQGVGNAISEDFSGLDLLPEDTDCLLLLSFYLFKVPICCRIPRYLC